MKKMVAISLCALFGFGQKNTEEMVVPKNFYELKAISLQGKEISMDTYKGKVVLIVNTASKCGFTPQYAGLEELYQKYKDKGLVILGFPCNQFLKQEPGTSEEIQNFCQINYGVSFQMFEKIDVNGPHTHPIYRFLKNALPGKITWNFNKFLLDKNGKPYKRYPSQTLPKDLEADIEALFFK
jgi:glutathione peroxidase